MFDQNVMSREGSRAWTTGAGLAAQGLLVGLALLAPLVLPQSGLQLSTLTHLVFPGAPPAPQPPGPAVRPHDPRTATRPFRPNVPVAPTSIPAHPVMLVDDPADFAPAGVPITGVQGGTENGVPGGVIGTILSSTSTPPPPPRPVAVPAAQTAPVVVAPPRIPGGRVEMARVLQRVEPVYPELAKRMRVSGTVELMSVIGIDGRIREVRVISGHPLLAPAALAAVRQWLYAPTRLNGVAVEVEGPITVNFRLN